MVRIFNRMTSSMQSCGEDVTEIQVKPDGCWRVKPKNERGILAQWHNADGTLCPLVEGEFKPKMDVISTVGCMGGLEGTPNQTSLVEALHGGHVTLRYSWEAKAAEADLHFL